MTYQLIVPRTGKARSHQAYLCVAAVFEALYSVVMHYYNYSHLNSGKDGVSYNYVSSGIFSSQKERDDSVIRLLQ